MMERCHIQTIDCADHITVRIVGEVDLACAEYLTEALHLALAAERPVVVDCSQITFMDSIGLRTLLEARIRAQESSVNFELSPVSEPVGRVLELAGMTSLFDLAGESEKESAASDS